jgi:outer membrane lipoprotein carrier protein
LTAVLTAFLLAIVIGASTPPGTQASDPGAAELARAVQEKYAFVQDFSADFVHRYRGGVLRKEATERGTVLIKKPGLMRWTYTSPESKIFVSDGTRMYAYIPEDRQVTISQLPAENQATSPALFLAGKGNITRDFVASYPATPDPTPASYTLTLTPKKAEAEYDRLTLVVARGTLRLLKLITEDAQGGESSFTFTNLRENAKIPDKEFRFTIPKGVDVITDGQRIR